MDKYKEVLEVFDKLNIKYDIVYHKPVYTIEEIYDLGYDAGGVVAKNLFLRNDNGKQHYLVVLEKNKTADLKLLRNELNSSRLSFASEERLYKYLKLNKGSVTPLGIINDKECSVEVVFDEDLIDKVKIGVHPNDNTATVFLDFSDLIKVIESNGNKITYVKI